MAKVQCGISFPLNFVFRKFSSTVKNLIFFLGFFAVGSTCFSIPDYRFTQFLQKLEVLLDDPSPQTFANLTRLHLPYATIGAGTLSDLKTLLEGYEISRTHLEYLVLYCEKKKDLTNLRDFFEQFIPDFKIVSQEILTRDSKAKVNAKEVEAVLLKHIENVSYFSSGKLKQLETDMRRLVQLLFSHGSVSSVARIKRRLSIASQVNQFVPERSKIISNILDLIGKLESKQKENAKPKPCRLGPFKVSS